MSVPLDRLYNFLHDVCDRDDIIIYRFFPHGSRKITDCKPIVSSISKMHRNTAMYMVCHDQEPLELDAYAHKLTRVMHKYIRRPVTMYDKVLLLHSEQNSKELQTFENDDAIGVYWWSHALIARDWFRYAQLDPKLAKKTIPSYDFLIYNRAWAGSREYRLQFSELVVTHNLTTNCYMNFSENDGDVHYLDHQFKNQNLAITHRDLEKHFRKNTASAEYSADYNADEYNQCYVEVILETLFDDSRLHLTEKSLRPIACGKPFIIAGTAGSLEYLRRYGFKTFSPWIDETYDTIIDPKDRLQAIVKSMQKFSSQPLQQKQKIFEEMQEICNYNKSRFFSSKFTSDIINELTENLDCGIKNMQAYTGQHFKKTLRGLGSVPKCSFLFSRQELVDLWKWLKNN